MHLASRAGFEHPGVLQVLGPDAISLCRYDASVVRPSLSCWPAAMRWMSDTENPGFCASRLFTTAVALAIFVSCIEAAIPDS